jgi:CBS domain-containing protein
MRAEEIMQKDVITVSPDLPVKNFEGFLTEEEISGAPVVANDGRLLGVASKTDVVRALSEEVVSRTRELMEPELTVEDIMTRGTVVVSPEDDIRDVARQMVEGHLHRVLVVEEDSVVGIVTAFDLLRVLAG